MSAPSPIPDSIWSLPTRHLGRRCLIFATLESTSTLALGLGGDPRNAGVVVLAREQAAGRGQYGRTWQAPAGSSVLMSVLLFPPPQVCRPALLTAWAAVSVGEVILELTGLQAKIKWPNDVYLHGKKVCGILIEQRRSAVDAPPATVAGIGLNVCQPASFFEAAELPLGASLLSQSGRSLDPDVVARLLLERLDREYGRLLDGDLGTLESLWKERLGIVGQPVVLEATDGQHRGRLLEVTFDGLVLAGDDGTTQRLLPESVRQVRPLLTRSVRST